MKYLAKTKLPLNSIGIICRYSAISPIGIIFHSCFFYQWGENTKGLQHSPFLAINAKGGENIKPKAK
jgi:hypothetical protein